MSPAEDAPRQGRPSPLLPLSVHSLDMGKLADQAVSAVAFAALGVFFGGAPWLIPSRWWALVVAVFRAPMALVFLLAALMFFLRPWPYIGLRVSVHSNGLTWKRFSRVVSISWDEIVVV